MKKIKNNPQVYTTQDLAKWFQHNNASVERMLRIFRGDKGMWLWHKFNIVREIKNILSKVEMVCKNFFTSFRGKIIRGKWALMNLNFLHIISNMAVCKNASFIRNHDVTQKNKKNNALLPLMD